MLAVLSRRRRDIRIRRLARNESGDQNESQCQRRTRHRPSRDVGGHSRFLASETPDSAIEQVRAVESHRAFGSSNWSRPREPKNG